MAPCNSIQKIVVLLISAGLAIPTVAAAPTIMITDWTGRTQRATLPSPNETDCHWHQQNAKFALPLTKRDYNLADYWENGYFHIVVNVHKCNGTSKGPGSSGTVRLHQGDKRLYYHDNGQRYEWVEGYATHYGDGRGGGRRISSAQEKTITNPNGVVLDELRFGPPPGPHSDYSSGCPADVIGYDWMSMTPIELRARVWLTNDPNWRPPKDDNASDKVGFIHNNNWEQIVKAGSTAMELPARGVARGLMPAARLSVGMSTTADSRSSRGLGGASFYTIRGQLNGAGPTADNASVIIVSPTAR